MGTTPRQVFISFDPKAILAAALDPTLTRLDLIADLVDSIDDLDTIPDETTGLYEAVETAREQHITNYGTQLLVVAEHVTDWGGQPVQVHAKIAVDGSPEQVEWTRRNPEPDDPTDPILPEVWQEIVNQTIETPNTKNTETDQK